MAKFCMDAKSSLTRSWLIKARRDLLSAQKLARGKEPYYDTAIYHCQQAAEKAVKGWLVYHDTSFGKTHDLRLLVTLAMQAEPRFTEWQDAAALISPYAMAYRYPGEELEPTEEEFKEVLKSVGKLYEFVCSLLPSQVSAYS